MSHSNQMAEYERQLHTILRMEESGEREVLARQLYFAVQQTRRNPITVHNRACFLFHGQATTVALAGDWTHWQISSPLKRIAGTDLFYQILEFPYHARLQYKFVVDNEWMVDPANARIVQEGFGTNSEFLMPHHQDNSDLWQQETTRLSGTISRYEFKSSILGERRELYLYSPPETQCQHIDYPLLIVHDGSEAMSLGRFHIILDNLVHKQLIYPCLAIFIPPHDRGKEYMLNERYVQFSVEETIPFAQQQFEKQGYVVSSQPLQRCVTGASLGGLVALWSVARYSSEIACCITQSGAFWPGYGEIFRSIETTDLQQSRVIIQTGTIGDACELSRLMYMRLRARGVTASYREYAQGHTWGNWRNTFPDSVQEWIGTIND